MGLKLLLTAYLAVLAVAAPVARPNNFQTDSFSVGDDATSSYAKERRANFETDVLLGVGDEATSSYARERRSNFETDVLLGVGDEMTSSYT